MDATLLTLARASNAEDGRGDTFGAILRAADDLDDLPPAFARVAQQGGGVVDLRDDFRQSDRWRLLVATDRDGAPVVAAVPLEDSEEALELLGDVLWITVAAVIAIALVAGLAAGLLAQRRLHRISRTLTALGSGDLSARTGITLAKDDLDDMARQVDQTASELERLVAQTRHLSATLAHDLRTPLARLRSRLEALPPGEEKGGALEEAERLSGIFDTIMRVARIEASQGTDGFEPVHLGHLAEDLAETFGPVVEDGGKKLTLDVSAPATVAADRQMLVQAMANLIQNAMRYGGAQITLTARGNSIGVADNGPGVDPASFSEIVKPMVRLDRARQSDGAGLGLAVVKAVADRHGASLVFAQSQPQGLSAMLKFADL